jgi:hypothetical protein
MHQAEVKPHPLIMGTIFSISKYFKKFTATDFIWVLSAWFSAHEEGRGEGKKERERGREEETRKRMEEEMRKRRRRQEETRKRRRQEEMRKRRRQEEIRKRRRRQEETRKRRRREEETMWHSWATQLRWPNYSQFLVFIHIYKVTLNCGWLMIASPVSKILIFFIQLSWCYFYSWMDRCHHNLLIFLHTFTGKQIKVTYRHAVPR